MPIPIGAWHSTGLFDSKVAFERARSVAQGIAGGVIGSHLQHTSDSLSPTSQNLISNVGTRNREHPSYQPPPQVQMRTPVYEAQPVQLPQGPQPFPQPEQQLSIGEQVRAKQQARLQFLAENGLPVDQLSSPQRQALQYVPDEVVHRAVNARNLGEIPGEPGSPTTEPGVAGSPFSLGELAALPIGATAGLGEAVAARSLTGVAGALGRGALGIAGGEAGGRGAAYGAKEAGLPPGLQLAAGLAGGLAGGAAGYMSPEVAAHLASSPQGRNILNRMAAEAGGTQLPSELGPGPYSRALRTIDQRAAGRDIATTADQAPIEAAVQEHMAATNKTAGQLLDEFAKTRAVPPELGLSPQEAVPQTGPATTFPGVTDVNLEKPFDQYFTKRGQYLGPALRRTYKDIGFTKPQIDQIASGQFPELLPRVSGAGGLAENTTDLRRRLLAERGQGFFGKETQFPMQHEQLLQDYGGKPPGEPPAPPIQPAAPEPLQPGTVPSPGYGPPNQPPLMPDLPAPSQPPLKLNLFNELAGLIGSTMAHKAALDQGALGRQAQVLGWQNPKRWLGLIIPSIRATFSERASQAIMSDIKTNRWYEPIEAGPRAGLGFKNRLPTKAAGHEFEWGPGVPQTERAGGFVGLNDSYISRVVQRLPWIKGSERNYAVVLNKQGGETFGDYSENMWNAGWSDVITEKGVADRAKLWQALREVVNHGRGYGAFNAGVLGKSVSTLFSGRNFIAKFQVALDPFVQPGALWKASPRQLAAKNLVSMVAGDTAILGFLSGVGALTGVGKVEWNPLAPGGDWVKYKIGDTRIDPWGGFSPMARLITRMSAAALTETGAAKTQWDTKTVGDQLKSFFENKEAPVVRLFTDATGISKSLGSKPLSPQYLADLWTPFVADDVWQAVKAHGIKGAAVAPASEVGVGVQTYQTPVSTGLRDIPKYTGIDPAIQTELYRQGGFNDLVSEARREMIQKGVPQARVSQIPEENFIKVMGAREGKDANFIAAATLLSKPSEAKKHLNPDWLRFVIDNEAQLREQRPDIFNQDLEEFLRRVHAGKAAGQ